MNQNGQKWPKWPEVTPKWQVEKLFWQVDKLSIMECEEFILSDWSPAMCRSLTSILGGGLYYHSSNGLLLMLTFCFIGTCVTCTKIASCVKWFYKLNIKHHKHHVQPWFARFPLWTFRRFFLQWDPGEMYHHWKCFCCSILLNKHWQGFLFQILCFGGWWWECWVRS